MYESKSYRIAKQQHDLAQLREDYRQRSVGLRERAVDHGRKQSKAHYSKVQHYLPSGFAVGVIAITGAVAIAAFNRSNRRAYESVFLSSW